MLSFLLSSPPPGNYVFEEIMNSLTHGIGFIASVVGTILLMTKASIPEASPYHFWSCTIFCCCLMLLYLSSTLYHRLVVEATFIISFDTIVHLPP